MLRPNSTFKLSKSTKRMLCTIADKDKRDSWRHAMIQAELAAAIVPKSTKQDRRPQLLTGYVAVDGSTTSASQE